MSSCSSTCLRIKLLASFQKLVSKNLEETAQFPIHNNLLAVHTYLGYEARLLTDMTFVGNLLGKSELLCRVLWGPRCGSRLSDTCPSLDRVWRAVRTAPFLASLGVCTAGGPRKASLLREGRHKERLLSLRTSCSIVSPGTFFFFSFDVAMLCFDFSRRWRNLSYHDISLTAPKVLEKKR